ncbi:hypothetical protein GCM10008959_14500 [Deinococcus seoulensis]|uniref:Uncharacterized protein n=1 Tax=Deinococcus seoulensis TaxID=1837379 RepID=A0ABQ2RR25_9DEIO|nr:hypothetical protein GCM10008959_14500 [Deinococcus seoulensis]
MNGLQSPFDPSEASGSKTGSGRGAGNPVKFRIVGETNGSPYKDAHRGEAGLSAGSASRFYLPSVVRGVRIGRVC